MFLYIDPLVEEIGYKGEFGVADIVCRLLALLRGCDAMQDDIYVPV